jgi:dihydrofolate reductase
MKLTTVTNVSVDGLIQGLGGPDDDRRGGFERGGWALPLFENDNEAATFLNEVYQRPDAFLIGRQTYEIFAGSWGSWADPGNSRIWTALEHEAQVRRIDHTLRTALGEHDRPLR